jgi:hypothetical protein
MVTLSSPLSYTAIEGARGEAFSLTLVSAHSTASPHSAEVMANGIIVTRSSRESQFDDCSILS